MSYWEGRWRQYCPISGHLKIFLGVSRKNSKKWFFFAFGQITRDFELVWPIQGRTMWKLTSWEFRKCGSFRDFEVLNRSYACSKSEDFEILSPLPKIRGVAKKRHGHNNEFWALPLNQRVTTPNRHTLIPYQRRKLIIVAVSFFWNAYFFFWIWPDFDSL